MYTNLSLQAGRIKLPYIQRSLLGLLAILLIFNTQAWSQSTHHTPKCGHLSMHQQLQQRVNPLLKQQMEKARQLLEQQTIMLKQQQAKQRTTGTVLTIPIVFHVVHDGGAENISDDQITEAVKQINEDFRAQNPEISQVVPAFQNLVADVEVQFALAQKDPNGNPTSGITRTRSSLTYNGGQIALKQLIRWPRNMYLNVWVVRSSDGGNGSGFAFYPSSTVGANAIYDGVVASHWAIGRTGTALSTHYKLLTHEIGHWANLKHTWGDQSNNGADVSCNYDDEVNDTPNTKGTTGCNLTQSTCGSLDNTQNYMDYANCPNMFTLGQKTRMLAALNSTVAERNNLWSASNLAATLYASATPRVAFGATSFSEGIDNNGAINQKTILTLLDGVAFNVSNGELSSANFSISNLPAGLSAKITVLNNTSAELSFIGNAANHTSANSVSNISITFAASIFTSSIDNLTTNGITIDFLDPYKIIYKDITDIEVTPTATWTYFTLGFGNANYGIFYNASKSSFQLETYQKSAICVAGTRNLSPLIFNTVIGSTSQWVAGGAYPDLHDVSNATYTSWNGQTAYVGIRFSNAGNTHYGWLKIQVATNGQSYRLLEHAYHEQPDASIKAGQTQIGNTPTPPIAAFVASTTTITAGQQVTFTDQSTNTPTSWSWTFAGGSPANSSVQNPVVTYQTPGNYDVTLTVTNADGTNTLTKTAHVTVNAATCSYCTSASNRSGYEHIAEVKVGNFNNISGAANYTDFTNQTMTLIAGENNTIELTPGFSSGTYAEYFTVWIDYNGDCDFDDTGEQVYVSGSTTTTVSGSIIVPVNLAITTRMRISMKYNSAATSACGNFADGEVEDYTVNIVQGNTNPNPTTYCAASANITTAEHITRVKVGSIDNTSASGGYGNYTNQTTNMIPGQSYPMTVTPSVSWATSKLSVWVDWNRDGDFEDSGEATVANGSGPYQLNLSVPLGATVGNTRMRVRLSYGTALATSCGAGHTGEVEDYTINIAASGRQTGQAARVVNFISEEVQVFPNPSNNGRYSLDIPVSHESKTLIRIFNMQGKLVSTKTITGNQVSINLEGLPKGLYQMQVVNGQKAYQKTLIYQ